MSSNNQHVSHDLPEKWCVNRLEQLVFVDQLTLNEGTHPDFEFYYIDISSVFEGKLKLPSNKIQFRGSPSRARKVLHRGDVLMSTVRPNLKAFAYFDHSDDNCIASTGFAILSAKENVDSRFILYSILSDYVTLQIDSHVVGSNYPAINSRDVRRLEIYTPPHFEQGKISDILTTIDNLIEKTEALIAKYQTVKQGMMHDLFTRGVDAAGKLRPTFEDAPELYKESPIGWIPKEWEAQPLGSLGETASGGTPSRDNPLFWEGTVPWVKTGEIKYELILDTEEKITEWGLKNSAACLLPQQTVVMALFGQGPTRGRAGILGIEASVNQACLAFLPSSKILSKYLYFVLEKSYSDLRNLSNDGAQQNLNASLVKTFIVPVARHKEQRKIVEILENLESSKAKELAQLEKLRLQKSGLMQDLLTGKVRVTIDATEEPPAHV